MDEHNEQTESYFTSEEYDLLEEKDKLEALKATLALHEFIAEVSNYFLYSDERRDEIIKLASAWHEPFDASLCMVIHKPYFFINLSYLPKKTLAPFVFMPRYLRLLNVYVPPLILLHALQPDSPFWPSLPGTSKKTISRRQKTYVMKDENSGLLKIGKAIDPKFREATLQAQVPKIKVIKVFDANIESKLHKAFASKRVRGEWFNVSLQEIEDVASVLMDSI